MQEQVAMGGETASFGEVSSRTMVMGLKVVSADTGQLLDPGTAVLRYVGYLVSGIPIYLGFLWMLWDPKKETWHDKIAKTRVVKVAK